MAKQKKQAPAQYAPRQREIEYPKFVRTAKVFLLLSPRSNPGFLLERERETGYVPSKDHTRWIYSKEGYSSI